MESRKQAVIPIAAFLFLLNFIFGIALLNEGLFHYDSVMLAQAVEKTYQSGILQPSLNGRYGSVVLNAILYLPFHLAGENADFTTRLSSVLFHSLSIVALFLFVKEFLRDRLAGFFAALFLSFTPFYFSPNTYGKEHGASIFFLLLSFYFLLRGLDRKSLVLLGLASISFVFSVSIRESMLATLPVFALLYFITAGRLKAKNLAVWLLSLLAGLSFLYFTYLKGVIHQTLFVKNDATVYFLGLFSPVLQSASNDLYKSIPLPVFIFFIFGIIMLVRRRHTPVALFLLCWFPLFFYFGNTSCYVSRHLDLVIIPVFISVAYLFSGAYLKYKWIVMFFVFSFVLGMLVFMYPMLYFRHHYNGEKRFALYVNEKTENNAIIIAMDDSPFIEYYGARKAITHPVDDAGRMRDFTAQVKGYVQSGIPVYAVESAFSYDRQGIFRKDIQDNFSLQVVGRRIIEDFHRPELRFRTYEARLFRLYEKDGS